MATTRTNAELGERIATLAASFEAEKTYQHDRWHKQDQDLAPLTLLPERMTREIGKLHGLVDGRVSSISQEVKDSVQVAIKEAIRDAITPIADDVREIKAKLSTHDDQIDELQSTVARWSGARVFAAWLVGILVAVAGTTATILGIKAAHG